MTPEERLDQLEPLLSETTAILDRHTAQLRQHAALLRQLVQATESNTQLMQQLLAGQANCLEHMALLNAPLPQPMETNSPTLFSLVDYAPEPAQRLEELDARLETMGSQLETLGSKMDLILTKLIRVYINN
ncbi:hypothetical protein D0N36_00835 [Hymenobacter lapidiphilus]|uniref:hypothetical protein n=1 Tax=Hymenobacter sp. CCM 8763 TaxID=2303334 RepID=UPI000E355A32|nr:hypothetical protein [Hymenobacter sp. CCM 8763]RFP67063.1 hypothetical protein D0N36_00835 [Hymenobacter sp. CCM 8763]